MRLLVTGGCGFIGSHLIEALLARGDEVVCLDSLDDFYSPAVKRRNIRDCEQSGRFTFIQGDIRDSVILDHIGKSHAIEAIVHLAARAGVRPSIRDPKLYADVNLAGTSSVLEMARRFGIRSFVFASSSSVYGERTDVPFRESDPVEQPASPYAATKRSGELLAYTYHHLYGMNVTCLRFFTVYGPRQRPEMAIHKFTRLIHSGQPVPMYGDGSASRDFTYVDDIVQGVVAAIARTGGYRIYNLGNSRMITLHDLIQEIGTALEAEPRIDQLAPQAGDISITCADISRAQADLDYRPATPFADGLRRFADWYLAESVQA